MKSLLGQAREGPFTASILGLPKAVLLQDKSRQKRLQQAFSLFSLLTS